jgi:hypothetical protein
VGAEWMSSGDETSNPCSAMHFLNSGGNAPVAGDALLLGVSTASRGAGFAVVSSSSPPQLENANPITAAPIATGRFIVRSLARGWQPHRR